MDHSVSEFTKLYANFKSDAMGLSSRTMSAANRRDIDIILISPQSTQFLYDHSSALDLIRSRRWRDGLFCPRCYSSLVHKIVSCKVLEAYNCAECHYNFNSVSRTFFHGSKMGLHLQLQVLSAFDLLHRHTSLRQIAALTGLSYKTAKLQFARIDQDAAKSSYIFCQEGDIETLSRHESICTFFEQAGVKINLPLFLLRLDDWLFQ